MVKAILGKAERTENTSAFLDFAQTIDFTRLFDKIREVLKHNVKFPHLEITTIRGQVHINFYSNDITDKAGIFSTILKETTVNSFNNYVCHDKENNRTAYWVNVNISYQHKDGGSNGMELLTAWYNTEDGWTFRTK